MMSPSTFVLSRQAPPVRPSRSLEGLEKVVPPGALSASRSRLHLDKPLPDLPTSDCSTGEIPFMAGTTAWSDDSSTVNSFEDHDDDDDELDRRQSSISTESYPVFVRSGSDELTDFVDHPSVSTLDRTPSVDRRDKPGTSALAYTTFLAEDRYSPPPHWVPTTRSGPNHYFREKKWDFFPELATPSALPQNSPSNLPPRPRKKDSMRSRWISTDKGAALANDVRNSIRSLVQRRLSRNSIDKEKPKRDTRPTTSPEYTRQHTPPQRISPTNDWPDYGSTVIPQSPAYAPDKSAHLSISPTGSSLSDESLRLQQPVLSPRKKQLAVPISPYQKYGAAIWDKSGKEKRVSYRQSQRVRFPKYRKPLSKNGFAASTTPPLSPASRKPFQQGTRHCVRVLQDGTSHMLVAIDNTRKKMAGVKVDRRRSQLKSKIRLVGPVNPYTSYRKDDPWV
ncbi:hypothetical protein BJY01DRAFT_25873 [Aspergillus pseudoustus]|uniref:Uncharacterized protein n=1 Tax=Aspergillus pseudoustus TaxID=1810923 RepID=A0ABR4KRH0_9EURO